MNFVPLSNTNRLHLCRSISGAQPFNDFKMKKDNIFHWSSLFCLPLAGFLKAVVSEGSQDYSELVRWAPTEHHIVLGISEKDSHY